MTFLNTISNLGSKWPNFLSLWLLPKMTISSCMTLVGEDATVLLEGNCLGLEEQCTELGGTCVITTDGYTVQQFLGTAIGVLWVFFLGQKVLQLERAPATEWLTTNGDEKGSSNSKHI